MQLLDICSLKEILELLNESESTIDRRRAHGIKNPLDPMAWQRGIHWFQPNERGRITYNKAMIQIWLVAVSQEDRQMHLNAIAEFQRSIPGAKAKRFNVA
ncbi:hypothetical protein IQ250_26855 [Pseudanabaenaceae cyanobacterium LEGE 13415]|nr:hypothetical protein [Pseudanabaenaceae cyanobacterium LEGE 13415]